MTALLSLLQNIQQHSQQLLDFLNQEKRALNNNELQNLNEIAMQKQAIVDQLNQLDKQRESYSSSKNFNQFIKNSNDKSLIKQWDITRNAIASCQKQNEINGRLLNKRSKINQDILTIMTGRDQPADETYNAAGNQTHGTSLLSGIKA
ncbi:hypothetical protein MNBD_GAMMA08-733 [hydrothermal vent metagenome]|uniref:Flagellar biosynthesis protein FlgN n=1 Tax=hydrothermal vent metagenome TaxID=652676 RepID=A0A3B0X5Q3_9ZZZZ